MGVLIQSLGGNEETVNTVKAAIGKKIASVELKDDELQFIFKDGTGMKIYDGGQSCCEHRYMRTDDDLKEFTNTILKDIELKSAPDIEDGHGDCHEVQFLEVITGKGSFVCSNHNEHNGNYGGFWIVAGSL